MRLPDFLIVGAMKAGTTTMYFDLLGNPAVSMPSRKEPGNLLTDEVCSPRGRRAYARLFRRTRPHQICGEASTGYSKLPDYPGVPDRARRELGGDLKVIYLVREPVSRIMSHHHHERFGGRISCGIDEAVRQYPRFIEYSSYARQITPWIETFGSDQVRIIGFEPYIRDRRGTIDDVSRFLGIPARGDLVASDVVYNRSAGKPVPEGPLKLLRTNAIYRKLVRPMLSGGARDALRRFLLPKAPDRPETPSAETVRFIVDELADDIRRLGEIMGARTPLWNLADAETIISSSAPAGPTDPQA